jgi:hypothetical protein
MGVPACRREEHSRCQPSFALSRNAGTGEKQHQRDAAAALKLRVVVKPPAAGRALAQVDEGEAGVAQLRYVVLDRPVMPDRSGTQPLLWSRGPVDAPVAHSTRVQQFASNLGGAAAEVKHPQSRRRAQLVKERRALHGDVRVQRPRTVLPVPLEQLRVVVERAAAPITGISGPRLRRAAHSKTRSLPPPAHAERSAAKARVAGADCPGGKAIIPGLGSPDGACIIRQVRKATYLSTVVACALGTVGCGSGHSTAPASQSKTAGSLPASLGSFIGRPQEAVLHLSRGPSTARYVITAVPHDTWALRVGAPASADFEVDALKSNGEWLYLLETTHERHACAVTGTRLHCFLRFAVGANQTPGRWTVIAKKRTGPATAMHVQITFYRPGSE